MENTNGLKQTKKASKKKATKKTSKEKTELTDFEKALIAANELARKMYKEGRINP
jgi:hypothetical protein